MAQLWSFLKRNYVLLVVALVVLTGSFLRLYRLRETMMFQGDQGRDAIVVKRMIIDKDPTLLGPVTSVGNMYLGPFYYYFMAPFLAVTYPDPVGPALGVAMISITTLVLIFEVARRAFSIQVALLSTLLLSFMHPAIVHSRFSWNPNIAPFFSLLLFWFLYLTAKKKEYRYLLGAAVAFALLIQLHYLTLLTTPAIGLFVIWLYFRDASKRRSLGVNVALSLLIVLASFAPLILFDMTHNQIISSGFSDFFGGKEDHLKSAQKIWTIVRETQGRSFRIMAQLIQSPNGVVDRLITYSSLIAIGSLMVLKKIWKEDQLGLGLVLLFIFTGIAGSALYTGTVFDHYLLYLLPFLSLFYAYLLSRLFSSGLLGKGLTIGLVGIFLQMNLAHTPAYSPTPTTIDDYKQVATEALKYVGNERYNVVLLSESKDYKAMNYRYFMEVTPNPPQPPENYQDVQKLIVINEARVADPRQLELYEIQTPGLSTVSAQFETSTGVNVWVLE